ncbi:MAG: LacI family DNA-binding transcriptional regulator [Anaerolineales bacterium]
MPKNQRPTLQEIAEACGVSIATVSAALNNQPSVSAKTRSRVLDVAISLGYEPKEKNIRGNDKTLKTIGLLVKHDAGVIWDINPFYSLIQLGVTNTCQQHSINLMVANIEVDASNRPIAWPAMIDEQRIDGLIMAGAFIDETVQMVGRRAEVPIVLVDGCAPELGFDTVATDNYGGAQTAVRHLVENGHTRIGLVGWNPLSPPSIHQRMQGYLDTLSVHRLEPFISESVLSRAGGQDAARQLLDPARKVTAIFACNDETALGVMNTARSLNLEIPRDLSLVGFDNIDMAAEVSPPLTTIHVHKTWMGSLGVQMLMDRVRMPQRPKITTTITTDLIRRESVARI